MRVLINVNEWLCIKDVYNMYIFTYYPFRQDLLSLIYHSTHYPLGYTWVLTQALVSHLYYLSGHSDIGLLNRSSFSFWVLFILFIYFMLPFMLRILYTICSCWGVGGLRVVFPRETTRLP